MAPSLQPIRGTHDLLPEDHRRHRFVTDRSRQIVGLYGYEQAETPILEFVEVFARTLGDTSDVVTKEMYAFADRGGEQITLRPENTAAFARAVMSNGLYNVMPLKFFYSGPMFRYERPQKGRQRQFHQIGAELFGVPGPLGDVEIIAMGDHVLRALGLAGRYTLELNTLGDMASRHAYRDALVAYFRDHEGALSEDSRARLQRNPLRILDSKDQGDQALVAGAPSFDDYLNAESTDFFAAVREGLEAQGVAYRRNTRLVRGLDYYCHSAFEFTTTELGAQGALLAGGRYDGLIETMGGRPTPGVGWAAGIERLAMMVADVPLPPRPVAVIPVGDANQALAMATARQLREAGCAVELGFSGNLKRRMARANKLNARFAVMIGDSERESGMATVRDLDSGGQRGLPFDGLADAVTGPGFAPADKTP